MYKQYIGEAKRRLKVKKFGFSRNSNPKVVKFYVTIRLKLVFQNELFLPALRKDILRRICPIDLKFSGFVDLSKFCRMSIELFHPLHFAEVMH